MSRSPDPAPDPDPDAAADPGSTPEIRSLTGATEMAVASDLLRRIWGAPADVVPLEMLVAIAHAGGYVVGAFVRDGSMVGVSVGFLGVHDGQPALHSHVTGLTAAQRGRGLGRALKVHQREWAAARGLPAITWTFDPLVRRNAWFNLAVLGADVDAYLPSFYGQMHDEINAGDDSDRLHVVWPVRRPLPAAPRDDTTAAGAEAERVPTPADIVALRRSDPVAARRWRSSTRAALTTALADGRPIVGFTADGDYLIGSRR